MVLALEIFTRSGGVFASTWAHVLVGIMWIGLLYYFNFVQVPSFAELDAQARNQAIDKLASRALVVSLVGIGHGYNRTADPLGAGQSKQRHLLQARTGCEHRHRNSFGPRHVSQRLGRHLAQSKSRNR